jgi:hypothetical protein
LRGKNKALKRSLESEDFIDNDTFLLHNNISSYDEYLSIIRARNRRPMVFLMRNAEIDSFHPWIASVLNSNMDIQFVLDVFSCATYVPEYVNKTDRGKSNLQRTILQLQE